jgi:hypothetical protein
VEKIVEGISKNRLSSFDAEPALKKATVSLIRNEIAAVYGVAQPNINKLPAVVQARLKKLGYEASGRQIKEIGSEPQFKHRRRRPGQKIT